MDVARRNAAPPSAQIDPLCELSIVVPIGPGDTAWPPLLRVLAAQAGAAELIPVFSTGDAQRAPSSSLRAAPGRAAQQNAGATAATRRWLWFVHADTRLDAAAIDGVRRWLHCHDDASARALGWCRLGFIDDGPRAMRCNALGANLRARLLGLPFGDQGLLLRHDDFVALGGFDPSLAYGEDHALVWRARRAGIALRAIDATLMTSARKYARHGWLRTTLHHLRLTAVQVWTEARR